MFSDTVKFNHYEQFLQGTLSFVNTGRADQSSYHGFTSQSSCKVEKEVYESLFGGEPKPEVKKTILSVVKNQETQGLFLLVPGSSSSDLPSQPLGLGIVDMLSTKLLV